MGLSTILVSGNISLAFGFTFLREAHFWTGCNLLFSHFQQPLLLSALAGRLPALGLTLLGAGSGPGSCFAPPYRVANVEFPAGCPPDLSCCNEFGYCRSEVCAKDGILPLEINFFETQVDWLGGAFRDCNGVSNGQGLPDDVIKLEVLSMLFLFVLLFHQCHFI